MSDKTLLGPASVRPAPVRPVHQGRTAADKLPETPSRSLTLPLDKVEAAIRSIQYGVVQVIIQDGLIVQIDKTEKIRLR